MSTTTKDALTLRAAASALAFAPPQHCAQHLAPKLEDLATRLERRVVHPAMDAGVKARIVALVQEVMGGEADVGAVYEVLMALEKLGLQVTGPAAPAVVMDGSEDLAEMEERFSHLAGD